MSTESAKKGTDQGPLALTNLGASCFTFVHGTNLTERSNFRFLVLSSAYLYSNQPTDIKGPECLFWPMTSCVAVAHSALNLTRSGQKYPVQTNIQWKPGNSNVGRWIWNVRMRSGTNLYQTFGQKTPASLDMFLPRTP
jgi:hypothetical protein